MLVLVVVDVVFLHHICDAPTAPESEYICCEKGAVAFLLVSKEMSLCGRDPIKVTNPTILPKWSIVVVEVDSSVARKPLIWGQTR